MFFQSVCDTRTRPFSTRQNSAVVLAICPLSAPRELDPGPSRYLTSSPGMITQIHQNMFTKPVLYCCCDISANLLRKSLEVHVLCMGCLLVQSHEKRTLCWCSCCSRMGCCDFSVCCRKDSYSLLSFLVSRFFPFVHSHLKQLKTEGK